MSSIPGVSSEERNPYKFTLGINFTRPRIDNSLTRKFLSSPIEKFVDAGVSAFDTADSYGYRNEIIGTFVKGRLRERYQIISKTFFPFPGSAVEDGKLSNKNIKVSIDYSLKALKTDYIDVLLAHRFDEKTDLLETITALNSEIMKGRILNWGFSEWTMEDIRKTLKICRDNNLRKPVMNQVQSNLLWRVSNHGILPFCKKENIQVLAWSPLAQGLSVGAYQEVGNYHSKSRMAKNKTPFLSYFENQELFEELYRFRSKHSLTTSEMAELSYFWLLERVGYDGVVFNSNTYAKPGQKNGIDSLSDELASITEKFAINSEFWVGKDSPND